MDTLRSMYVEYLERAHSALDQLDQYLMLHPKPLADAAQRVLDKLTEDVMQLIAGGIAIREEEEVNGYHPIDDEIDAAVHAVESEQDAQADAYEEQKRRADFFRDQLAEGYECPPPYLDYPCCEPCPYEGDDGIVNYAACWDEVERRRR